MVKANNERIIVRVKADLKNLRTTSFLEFNRMVYKYDVMMMIIKVPYLPADSVNQYAKLQRILSFAHDVNEIGNSPTIITRHVKAKNAILRIGLIIKNEM